MINCTLSQGKSLGCRDNIGGSQFLDVAAWAKYSYDFNGNVVNGTTSGTPVDFQRIEQDVERLSVKEVPVSSEDGASWYETTIIIQLKSRADKILDDELRTMVQQLHQGRHLVEVRDNNGNRKLYGIDKGMRTIEGAGGTGKELGSVNGKTITLFCKQAEPARLVEDGGAVAFVYNAAPIA